jgi:hypothetical protein
MDPAIDIEFSNGGEWSLDDSRVTCTITNKLERDFTNCMLKFYMPSSDTNIYQVSGVTDSQIVPVPDQPDWTIIYAYFDLPALSEHEILVAP